MLEIKIPNIEMFDETTQTFFTIKECTINLEHSLISVSKWEAKWHKAFLAHKDKTTEETMDYIKCMTVDKYVDDNVYYYISCDMKIIKKIQDYIADPMTAVVFKDDLSSTGKGRASHDVITSDLIYYWMITAQIPFNPCERWHLNRLLSLIKIYGMKNNPKKVGKGDIMRRNSSLNAARKASLGLKG